MSFIRAVEMTARKQGISDDCVSVLANMMSYIERTSWRGACHACSSALYVAFCECGIVPELCVGECIYGENGIPFDHSWLEINDKPIDLACAMRLDTGQPLCSPVVLGIDVLTEEPTDMRYGVNCLGLDTEARMVCAMPFCAYMDAFPNEGNGLWDIAGLCLRKKLSIEQMHQRYVDVQRVYCADSTR